MLRTTLSKRLPTKLARSFVDLGVGEENETYNRFLLRTLEDDFTEGYHDSTVYSSARSPVGHASLSCLFGVASLGASAQFWSTTMLETPMHLIPAFGGAYLACKLFTDVPRQFSEITEISLDND